MRTCPKCQESKAICEYYSGKGRCKSCVAEYNKGRSTIRYKNHRRWVNDNRPTVAEYMRRASDKRKAVNSAILREVKSNPCLDCGQRYDLRAMDLDHTSGVKMDKVSGMIRTAGEAKFRRELAKCELVCANCHRTRTYHRRMGGRTGTSSTVRHMRSLQVFVNQYKNTPCSICNGTFKHWQLDFDHIDPATKVTAVSELVRKRAAKNKIVAEILKCRVLCANCHRRLETSCCVIGGDALLRQSLQ